MKNILRKFLIIFISFSLIIGINLISNAVNYDNEIMLLDSENEESRFIGN